jgi:hypothetical protein
MAKKKLSSEDEARIALLRERMILTIRFIENAEDFPSGPGIRQIVQNAAQKGDLRTLRLMEKEVDAMTLALPFQEREGLEALLREKLGIDAEEERMEMHRRITEVLKRGTIASEKERRRLEDYAAMLEATDGSYEQIEAVRQLLKNA